jgi:hypothetical protein
MSKEILGLDAAYCSQIRNRQSERTKTMTLSRTLELLSKARESSFGMVFPGADGIAEGQRLVRAYNSLVDPNRHMEVF